MNQVESLSKIITGKPTLPARFVASSYDRFLFFDFFIRNSFDLFERLQGAVFCRQEIGVYCANALKLLMKISREESWAEGIEKLDDELSKVNDPFGLIVVSDEGRWVMAQDIPVNWGLVAFRSSDAEMVSVFDNFKEDWFLSFDDFVEAQRDSHSVLHEVFDQDFINQIVINYTVQAAK